MKIYSYPQETWNEQYCKKQSNYAHKDAFGNKSPKGIIAYCGSTYAQYGQTITFNGGTIIDDEWYNAVHRPLPLIHEDYEFYNMSGWGTAIRKKPS